ncbi:helix-turn-helix transcriptional regulator [Actinomycetospora sp.]|uniref:helix-turn-helix transcriptional regulator n=1 Tax=Actinomycetospora sp. TaxID=1872135 RepID=UPI002F3E9393
MTGHHPVSAPELPLDVFDDGMTAERRREAAQELVASLRRRREGGPGHRAGAPTLVDLAKASRRLRQVGRTSTMLAVGAEEAATVSGLERTVISGVTDRPRRLTVNAAHGVDDLATGHRRDDQGYDPGRAELEAMDSAAPVMVETPPTPAEPTVGSFLGHPHVVAPIVHAGKVIGLLHAAHDDGRSVDEAAVAGLSAFASMLSALWYCAAIESSWRDHLLALQQSVTENLDRLTVGPDEDLGMLDAGEGGSEPDGRPDERRPDERRADELRGRSLTPRERVVLKHLLEGAGNREIAEELVLTVDTIKSHVKRILRKLGATNRAELIHRVERHSPST